MSKYRSYHEKKIIFFEKLTLRRNFLIKGTGPSLSNNARVPSALKPASPTKKVPLEVSRILSGNPGRFSMKIEGFESFDFRDNLKVDFNDRQ